MPAPTPAARPARRPAHPRARPPIRKTGGLRDSQAGFSLIELLVVLGILAMLGGFVGPKVIGYFDRAKTMTAESQIRGLRAALDLYLLDTGRYPTQAEGLAALVEAPRDAAGWRGPYLQDPAVPADPWGNAYRYSLTDRGRPVVVSLGADGEAGGEGDAADLGTAGG